MIAGIGWAVMGIGALWMLLAAIGIHRMGSTLARLLVAGKAATMGIGAVLVGAAIVLRDPAGSGLLVLSALVLVVTTPAGAHALARSVRGVSPVAIADDAGPEADGDDARPDDSRADRAAPDDVRPDGAPTTTADRTG